MGSSVLFFSQVLFRMQIDCALLPGECNLTFLSYKWQVLSYESHLNNVTAVGFQCDGKWMYSGSEDGTVKIWDLRYFVLFRISVPRLGPLCFSVAAT